MTILIDFDIFQQQLSMIAFSYVLILVFRLRYTVEEHSGKILEREKRERENTFIRQN